MVPTVDGISHGAPMILVCPSCDARYKLVQGIAPPGRRVRCRKCAHVWWAASEPPIEPPPEVPTYGEAPAAATQWQNDTAAQSGHAGDAGGGHVWPPVEPPGHGAGYTPDVVPVTQSTFDPAPQQDTLASMYAREQAGGGAFDPPVPNLTGSQDTFGQDALHDGSPLRAPYSADVPGDALAGVPWPETASTATHAPQETPADPQHGHFESNAFGQAPERPEAPWAFQQGATSGETFDSVPPSQTPSATGGQAVPRHVVWPDPAGDHGGRATGPNLAPAGPLAGVPLSDALRATANASMGSLPPMMQRAAPSLERPPAWPGAPRPDQQGAPAYNPRPPGVSPPSIPHGPQSEPADKGQTPVPFNDKAPPLRDVPPVRRRSWAAFAGSTLVILSAIGLVGFIAVERDRVARAVPGAAGIYAKFGVTVNPHGLALRNVKVDWVEEENQRDLEVRGEIHNLLTEERRAPSVVVTVRDRAGAKLFHELAGVGSGLISRGGFTRFTARIPSPPAGIASVAVHFPAPK